VPVEWATSIPMELSPGESVLLLSPDSSDEAGGAGDILRLDYGVDTIPMLFMQGNCGPGQKGHNIRTDEGASRAADKIGGMPPLSGMVINLCQGGSGRVRSMADVSPSLRELFLLVKAFLQSPAKKFVVLIHSREDMPKLRFGC
jgi:hypothetical protein